MSFRQMRSAALSAANGTGGMMLIRASGGPFPDGLKKQVGRLQALAFEDGGIQWHSQFLPQHFTHRGASLYGYAKRGGEDKTRNRERGWQRSYTGRKFKKFGHTYPLVYTGESKRRALRQDVRATRKGVRVFLHANALNFKNEHMSAGLDMRREVTATTPEERNFLERRIQARLDKLTSRLRSSED